MTDAHLPDSIPVLPGVMVTGRYLLTGATPASRGDTLDAVPLPGRRLGLMVADVTGHGMDAAVAAAQVRAVLRERLLAGAEPEEAVRSVERQTRSLPSTCAATVCLAVLDLDDGRLRYVTAGHPAPLVVGEDGAWLLPQPGSRPLGTGGHIEAREARLQPGEMLVLYTDGLLGSTSRSPAEGSAQLLRIASAGGGRQEPSAAARGDRMCEELLDRVPPEDGCIDDAVLLLAERTATPEPLDVTVEARQENLPGLRGELGGWLDGVGAGLLDHVGLTHAVGELTTNAVRHAYHHRDDDPGLADDPGRTMTMQARHEDDGSVTIAVSDRGRWRPRRPDEEGGRGLMIAAGLSEDFRVEREAGGTVVRLGHALGRPVPLLQSESDPGHEEVHVEERDSGLRTTAGGGRLVVSGCVDLLSVDVLHDALQEVTRGATTDAVVDLSAVSYLCSCGVRALFEFLDRCGRSETTLEVIAEPGTPAAQVLALVDLPHLARAPR